jgi:xylan 1,4-beta-xylosidase
VNTLTAPASVGVTIGGIPKGVQRVLLEHYRIDDTHSNAYTVWQKMGSPQNPSAEQYAELQAAGHLELLSSPVWLDVKEGNVSIPTELPHLAISLLRLSW